MPNSDLTLYVKWLVNSYTLKMNINNPYNSTYAVNRAFTYGYDISSYADQQPSVAGFNFLGWFVDKNGSYGFKSTHPTMPAYDLEVFALWDYVDLTLNFYYNNTLISTKTNLHVGDVINSHIPNSPSLEGFVFNGWFKDSNFTQSFNTTSQQTMPAHDYNIYAQMIEKTIIEIDDTKQTYEKSKFTEYNLISNNRECLVEYYVNNSWTTNVPTEVGKYDIRITYQEDAYYKAFSTVIKEGLEITPDPLNVAWIYTILYALFIVEIMTTLFVMVLKKRKQALTPFSIILPFGIISTSQFVNLIISAVLAIAGFIFLVVELVQLNHITIYDDTRSDEEKQAEINARIKDVSTNETVSQNVDDLLKKEGFIDEE